MECMDFIILKVNGTDVSSSTHADAVEQFMAADEPIIVELIRRVRLHASLNVNTNHLRTSTCSSTTSSTNNMKEKSNDDNNTSFNTPSQHVVDVEPPESLDSSIYTNQSIINANRLESEQITSNTIQSTSNCSNDRLEDNSNRTNLHLDTNNGMTVTEDCFVSDSDSNSNSDSDNDNVNMNVSDNNYLLELYQNGCILNGCIGCDCCQINKSVTSSSSTVPVSSVSVSTQTYLTAIDWRDDIEDCFYHINLEMNSVPRTTPRARIRTRRKQMNTALKIIKADTSEEHLLKQEYVNNNDSAMSLSLSLVSHNNDTTETGGELSTKARNSFIDTQLQSINKEINDLDNRMNNIRILNTTHDYSYKVTTKHPPLSNKQRIPHKRFKPRLRPRSRSTAKIRTQAKNSQRSNQIEHRIQKDEHIYETIQESEPIYSLPYDPVHTDRTIVHFQRNFSRSSDSVDKKKKSKNISIYKNYNNNDNANGLLQIPTTTLYVNSSKSAYNTCNSSGGINMDREPHGHGISYSNNNSKTGEQSLSTTLTCKLGCNHKNRSILQLCSSESSSISTSDGYHLYHNNFIYKTNNTKTKHFKYAPITTNCTTVATSEPESTLIKSKSKSNNPNSTFIMHNDSKSKSLPNSNSTNYNYQMATAADTTMYTNMENLHHTILLQQQLFRRTLNQQHPHKVPTSLIRSNDTNSMFNDGSTKKTTINHGKHQEHASTSTSDQQLKMEWKVKRRLDGTRYITRRPIHNRILRNQRATNQFVEERSTFECCTTEDDTSSDIKVHEHSHLKKKDERRRQMMERNQHKYNKSCKCDKCNSTGSGVTTNNSLLKSAEPLSKSVPTNSHITLSDNNSQKINTGNSNQLQLQPATIIVTETGDNHLLPTCSTQFNIKTKKSSLKSKKCHKDNKEKNKNSGQDQDPSQGDGYDFKIVQDMIVNGTTRNTQNSNKMNGLLSVTTV